MIWGPMGQNTSWFNKKIKIQQKDKLEEWTGRSGVGGGVSGRIMGKQLLSFPLNSKCSHVILTQ